MQLRQPALRVLERGTTALSKHREVILASGAVLGTAALIHLLPQRLTWGKSMTGDDKPSDEPTHRAEGGTPTNHTGKHAAGVHELVAEDIGITSDMSFDEAFAHARLVLDKGQVFAWHGKLYNTFYKEEWEAMSTQEQEAFLDSINWHEIPADDVPPADDVATDPVEKPEIVTPEPDDNLFADEPVIGGDVPPTSDEEVVLPLDELVVELDLNGDPTTVEGVAIELDGDNYLDVVQVVTGETWLNTDGVAGLDLQGFVSPETEEFVPTTALAEPLLVAMDDPAVISPPAIVEISVTPADVQTAMNGSDFDNDADVSDFT